MSLVHGELASEILERQTAAIAFPGERPKPNPQDPLAEPELAIQLSGTVGERSSETIAPSLSCDACGDLELPVPPHKGAYLVTLEVIGGGNKGIVQKAWHPDSGREVAVKRLQRDNACPVRFVEFRADGFDSFHAEGHAPVRSTSRPWAGMLAFESANEHGNLPFESGSLMGFVALIRRGGGASFEDKMSNVLKGGASGVIFINSVETSEVYAVGSGQAALPSVMVSASEGAAAILAVQCGGARVEVRTDAEHEMAVCGSLPPHPNVIRVLDSFWSDTTAAPVIVMELCTGGPLRGPLRPESTALRVVAETLDGLSHLHAHGLCHRDLKPENVVLTRPLGELGARAVLVDFSMASRARRMSVPCGSPRYFAPEVLSGSYGYERDLWSAGIIAHELLFGRHPFGPVSDDQVLDMLASPAPVQVGACSCAGAETVSENARDLLRQLLQKDPRERISAANALAHPALASARLSFHGDANTCASPSGEQHPSQAVRDSH